MDGDERTTLSESATTVRDILRCSYLAVLLLSAMCFVIVFCKFRQSLANDS